VGIGSKGVVYGKGRKCDYYDCLRGEDEPNLAL